MFRNKTILPVSAWTRSCVSVSTHRRTQFWDSRYGSSRPRFFPPLEIFPPLDLCNGLLSVSSFPLLIECEERIPSRERDNSARWICQARSIWLFRIFLQRMAWFNSRVSRRNVETKKYLTLSCIHASTKVWKTWDGGNCSTRSSARNIFTYN